ncbi:hypothetical protein WJX73_003378 [Symbiochloris irregularis]|uniref:Prefoldin subunit 2 n=1 Tax=Symbiochloris irregularis TaxID=706552 RepID=A0AAW1PRG7_9CHLO
MGEKRDPVGEKEIVEKFQALRSEREDLASSLYARGADLQEHEVVIRALQPLEGKRRCYRLIGDVLVERTVAEVLPAVQHNRDQLSEVVKSLKSKMEVKQKELGDFQAKFKIRMRGEGPQEPSPSPKPAAANASQGVLVGSS